MHRISRSLLALALLFPAGAALAEPAPAGPAPASLVEALRQSKLVADFTLRHEQVDDDALARGAAATTLRSALGFETRPFHGWSLRLEAEDESVGGADDYANGGFGSASNGVTGRPVIGDPEGTELHRAFVKWQGHGFAVQAGRDEILLGDQRFVGNVGWRQHRQTFDALSLRAPLGERWKLFYALLESVQRVNRATDELSGHLLAVEGDLGAAGKLTVHAESLDYDAPARRALSSLTCGAEWSGARALGGGKLLWELEAARQRDAGDNPRELDAGYLFASLGWGWRDWTVRGGWERLDGDAADGQFNTPLATLHKFNGWADKFLVTPVNGLVDRYLHVDGRRGAWSWTAAWHDFEAATGGAAYGSELDLQLLWKAKSGLALGAKAALYDADRHAADTEKLWVWAAFAL
ncbi:MAG TPA: alginate export family protein [Thermoanaerobaculia bacterium]|nr:alginate export family protein [Thermoanaerobaculia bacterium]